MELHGFGEAATDWSKDTTVDATGFSGVASIRTRVVGTARVRLIDYEVGYVADHWCAKGHLIYVLAGEIMIEHEDGSAAITVKQGMSWWAPDECTPAHRIACKSEARVFIVD